MADYANPAALVTPEEHVYPVTDPEAVRRLGL